MTKGKDINTALTNQELAENPTSLAASTFLMCSQCNYVSKLGELTNVQGSCQKCGQKIIPRTFPDLSAAEFLKMILYFYAKACDRHDDLKSQLQHVLREKIGRTYDSQLLIKTAKEIQKFYQHGNQSEYDKMLEIVRKRLSLQSQEESNKVFVPLLRYSDSFEEHESVVILTCALLEKLFDDLLVLVLRMCNGLSWRSADKKVDRLRSFDKRCEVFESITGFTFEKAIGQSSHYCFYSAWADIRKKRNDFVHGKPFVIKISTAEKSFNLAKNAFGLFAYLQNRFCFRRKQK